MPKKSAADDELDGLTEKERYVFEDHLRGLGFSTVGAYRAWCRDNGFPVKLAKSSHQRGKEREALDSQRVSSVFRRDRARRRPEQLFDDLFAGRLDSDALPPALKMVRDLIPTLGKQQAARDAFRDLLVRTHRTTKLFDPRPVIVEYPRDRHNSMIGAMASLATHYRAWIRPLEDWRPQSKNAGRQFSSLARHLLAEYSVPSVMDSVWFKRSRTQNWFLHLGRGQNLRTAERLFIPLTKRAAHELMQAPPGYPIEHAFRWGQVHALGGNPSVAEAVRATRLGTSFRHDDFWVSVIRFFIANPLLDKVHYGPIVDFIHNQKYESMNRVVRPGVVEREPPPNPGFSMRQRRPETLLRQVDEWHRDLGRAMTHGDRAWTPSGIGGLSLYEGDARSPNRRQWTIHELLSGEELMAEGRAMRHCVASYAGSCHAGRSSIWSMQRIDRDGPQRMLTIEVHPKRKAVVEARGRQNDPPTPKALEILRTWAAREDISIPGYVELR